MRNVTLLALFLTLCTVTAAVKCPNAKTECPQSAPCCNRHGYCSATPMDCYVEQGCQANASYTGACVSINPGCKSFREDFNDGSAVKKRDEYDGDPDKTRFIDEFDTVKVSDGFLHLTHSYDATLGQGKISRLFSTRWFRYGRISASLKTGLAPGLVNSFIYDSSADSDHVGDEIDYEWVYKDRTETQTNYYIDGIVDYTRGVPSYFKDPTTGTAQSTTDETFHLYEIEWLPNSISWIIDGKPARTVTRNGTDAFPDDFGKLFMSIWDTCKMPEGTKEWAGGSNPWCSPSASAAAKSAQYAMVVDYIQVKCYEEDTKPTKDYIPVTPKSARKSELGKYYNGNPARGIVGDNNVYDSSANGWSMVVKLSSGILGVMIAVLLGL